MKIYLAIIILFILSFSVYSQNTTNTQADITNETQAQSVSTSNTRELSGDSTSNIAVESINTNTTLSESTISETITNASNTLARKKPRAIDKNRGLFVDANFIGEYNPNNAGVSAGIFYRFDSPIKSSNPIFKGNRLDVGIENVFLLNANITGIYVNFIPTIFMELDVRAYYNATFNRFGYGHIGLSALDKDLTLYSIMETEGINASGYSISIAPKFKWLMASNNIEIANETNISFLSLGDSEFYLNRNTYEIYKKNDIEIINEFSLLTKTAWVKVGPSYSILYVVGTKTFVQSLDLQIDFEKYFLEESLRLYADLKSGFYLSSTYYQNTAFFNIKLGIQYQIL